MTEQELVERLRAYADDDHERLCEGRNYDCTCGYDERRDPLLAEAADTIARLVAERDEARRTEPQFVGVAKAKLDDLTSEERGWKICGYAIEKNGAYGLVTTGAFVGWWTVAANNASAAEAQRDKLKEVLEPLVRLTDGIPSDADWSGVEDFRRAREALASIEQEKPDV